MTQHSNTKQNTKMNILILDKKPKHISWDKNGNFMLIKCQFFMVT